MAKLELIDTSKTVIKNQTEGDAKTETSSEKFQVRQSNVFSKLSDNCSFKVNKPLIPLKVAVFCWFGAGAVITPFLAVYLRQNGLTLEKITFIYMVMPVAQLMGPTISGIIADKIGRSKPVLQANLLLAIATTISMLFIPKYIHCNQELIHCHSNITDKTTMMSYCDIRSNGSIAFNCIFNCSFDPKHQLNDFCFQDYISSCGILHKHRIMHNITSSIDGSQDEKYASCAKERKPESNGTGIDFWCEQHLVKDCDSDCKPYVNATENEAACGDYGAEQLNFIVSFVLLAAFHTFYSNCYRIVDVTSMAMTKTYNSDFGRQRFWSISGILVFSPLSGYVIDLASPENGPKKYEVIFYIFGAMGILTMLVVWKLDVKTDPPSKDMLKKIMGLLKNPDVIVFFTVIFVIGTAWAFSKLFSNLYLEDLKAPSTLMGLIPAVNSLFGLPFLLTSKWFVAKVGSSNLLILALLGYAAWCIGYSLLQNPWWSLTFEVLGIVNYHLLWVTVVTHSHQVAPVGLAATAISIAGGIHFGIGKGSGSVIGGVIMSKYDGRMAYRVMAGTCVGSAILYFLYVYIRKRFSKKEMDLKKIESGMEMDWEFDERFTPLIF